MHRNSQRAGLKSSWVENNKTISNIFLSGVLDCVWVQKLSVTLWHRLCGKQLSLDMDSAYRKSTLQTVAWWLTGHLWAVTWKQATEMSNQKRLNACMCHVDPAPLEISRRVCLYLIWFSGSGSPQSPFWWGCPWRAGTLPTAGERWPGWWSSVSGDTHTHTQNHTERHYHT